MPRSSDTAQKRWPSSWSRSSSAKTASSAQRSMYRVSSPPPPVVPVSRRRSLVVGLSASTARSPSPARRHAPSQSASSALIAAYPCSVSPEQQRAVAHTGGPLIVIGGAGTGKTTVLARRHAWLVEQGAAPEEVLVLAHSDAAADALRATIEELLARPYEELAVHTPHGAAQRLLHDEA